MTKLARIEKVMLLQSVDLFKFCTAEEVVRIAAISEERTFAADEEIYHAKDPADALYCIVEGSVRLQETGGETLVVGPRETFGVLEILSGRLRVGDARAVVDTVTLAIEAEDFFDLLSNNVEIVKGLFRELTVGVYHAAGGGLK